MPLPAPALLRAWQRVPTDRPFARQPEYNRRPSQLRPFLPVEGQLPAAYHERTGGTISPSVRRTCSCSQPAKPVRVRRGALCYVVLAPPTVPRFGELAAACETILHGWARAPLKQTRPAKERRRRGNRTRRDAGTE
jgi:hypothetical protein